MWRVVKLFKVLRCFVFDIEREVELFKSIEDVIIYEKESVSFDVEILEEDIFGEWKLKGEFLRFSFVSVFYLKLLVT